MATRTLAPVERVGGLRRRLSVALHDVAARLVRTLIRLAQEDGEERQEGLLLRRRPTQQELANMVGSCRESVSRAFGTLIRRGMLEPRGRGLVLSRKLMETVRQPGE